MLNKSKADASFNDNQQFPDTYQIAFEYAGDGIVGNKRLLLYEQRIWSPYREDVEGNHTIFYGTNGMMKLGKSGSQLFGPKNEFVPIKVDRDDREDAHPRNFLDAIRTGSLLNADIEVGHLSSSLCHLGNIVAMTGRALKFDPASEQIEGDEQATALLGRIYRENHWATPVGIRLPPGYSPDRWPTSRCFVR